MNFNPPAWELELFFQINAQWRLAVLDYLMPMVSSSLFLWIVALVTAAIVMLTRKAHWTVLITLALTMGASDLTCSIIKDSVGRVRPYQSVTGAWYIDSGAWVKRPAQEQTKKHGSSFPSAHAANAAAAALVVFLHLHWKSIWIMPIIIGYSRIYLGKHFPIDILGGWLMGLGLACILLPLYPLVYARARSLWIKYRLRI